MSMTRKDFEAIAQALAGAPNLAVAKLNVARVLEKTNPRFDTERFLKAAEA